MPQHRKQIAMNDAAEFLSRSFTSGETIAILLRRKSPTVTAQRIVTLELPLPLVISGGWHPRTPQERTSMLRRIRFVSGSRKRTKESVAEMRHLYLDLDVDGRRQTSRTPGLRLPFRLRPQSYRHPPVKYQVLWRVEDFTLEQQESTLKLLAIAFGGDPACTDCNRVLRLPGFLNQKYDPAHLGERRISQRFHVESRGFSPGYCSPGTVAVTRCNPASKGKRESTPIPSTIGHGFCMN